MNFLIRNSGRNEGACYIDYRGMYQIAEIAAQTKIAPEKLEEIYRKNGGKQDEKMGVYYFPGSGYAKAAIAQVLEKMNASFKGRTILLTEKEIDCIRRALISDGAVPFGIEAKLKDSILKKLNG